MWFGLVSLFPEMFKALEVGVTGRALTEQHIQLFHTSPRDFAADKHRSVDDKPYGGGPGMVMMVDPLKQAIQAAKQAAPSQAVTVFLSPQGRPFDQAAATRFAKEKALILVAGRYEGVDERLVQLEIDEEWSIGDFILTGGELAAMVMIDAITRNIPGVIGDHDSVTQDSLFNGLLKYPQYTRPETYEGLSVPDVLLSGHHQHIERWRLKASLGQTWRKRPDLLAQKKLTPEESALLAEFINEYSRK